MGGAGGGGALFWLLGYWFGVVLKYGLCLGCWKANSAVVVRIIKEFQILSIKSELPAAMSASAPAMGSLA